MIGVMYVLIYILHKYVNPDLWKFCISMVIIAEQWDQAFPKAPTKRIAEFDIMLLPCGFCASREKAGLG